MQNNPNMPLHFRSMCCDVSIPGRGSRASSPAKALRSILDLGAAGGEVSSQVLEELHARFRITCEGA